METPLASSLLPLKEKFPILSAAASAKASSGRRAVGAAALLTADNFAALQTKYLLSF